jgi:hypothetical protein
MQKPEKGFLGKRPKTRNLIEIIVINFEIKYHNVLQTT